MGVCVCVCVCWVNKWGMSCDSKCWVPVGLGFSVCLYDARCGPKKRCPIPIFFYLYAFNFYYCTRYKLLCSYITAVTKNPKRYM